MKIEDLLTCDVRTQKTSHLLAALFDPVTIREMVRECFANRGEASPEDVLAGFEQLAARVAAEVDRRIPVPE